MYNLKVRFSDKMHYLNPVTHLLLAVCGLYVRNIGRFFVIHAISQKSSKQLDILLKSTLPVAKGLSTKIKALMAACQTLSPGKGWLEGLQGKR